MKFVSSEITYREIPGEVCLAFYINGCPNRCPGCHSKDLWEDKEGIELTVENLKREIDEKMDKYPSLISCVLLMGGDQDYSVVLKAAGEIKGYRGLKTAWYSGRNGDIFIDGLPELDYVKFGPYIEEFGGLEEETTNQHLYKLRYGFIENEIFLYKRN